MATKLSSQLSGPFPCIKIPSYQCRIPMIKIIWSHDCLIFIMEIPYRERRSWYWNGNLVRGTYLDYLVRYFQLTRPLPVTSHGLWEENPKSGVYIGMWTSLTWRQVFMTPINFFQFDDMSWNSWYTIQLILINVSHYRENKDNTKFWICSDGILWKIVL